MANGSGAQTTWEERLRWAAETGEIIDLAPDLTGGDAVPSGGDKELRVRQLPGEAIRALLLDPELKVDPRGLRVRGAFVTGTLDLANAKFPCRLAHLLSI